MTIPTGKERLPVEAAPGAAKGSVWPLCDGSVFPAGGAPQIHAAPVAAHTVSGVCASPRVFSAVATESKKG